MMLRLFHFIFADSFEVFDCPRHLKVAVVMGVSAYWLLNRFAVVLYRSGIGVSGVRSRQYIEVDEVLHSGTFREAITRTSTAQDMSLLRL